MVATRPDLSQRTALSKSTLVTFDLCSTKAWFELRARRPLIPNEAITFGSALDRGVEAIAAVGAGQPIDWVRASRAALDVIEADDTGVDIDEVETALRAFAVDVAPRFDWTDVGLQVHIFGTIPGLGPVDGHPDIVFRDGRIFDVKSAKRAKLDEPTVELGFYALMMEALTDTRVPSVGYMTWVRPSRKWQMLEWEVTDELLDWTWMKASAYLRAKGADIVANDQLASAFPLSASDNVTMTGGPSWSGLCSDCQYAPWNGGECLIARRGKE